MLVTAYQRLAEGFAAEPRHDDRDPRRAAEVRNESNIRLSREIRAPQATTVGAPKSRAIRGV